MYITILNVISVIENYYYGLVIDEADDLKKVLIPVIAITLITLSEYYLTITNVYFNNVITEDMTLSLRKKIVSCFSHIKYSELDETSTGDLNSRIIGDLNEVVSFWANLVPSLYGKVVVLIAGLILCMMISIILTVLGFILVPFVIIMNVKISKPIENASLEARQAFGKTNGLLKNIIANKINIKSFILYGKVSEKYTKSLEAFIKAETRSGKLQALLEPVSALTHLIPNCITMIAGGILIYHNKLTAGTYITFLFTFNMVSQTLQSLRDDFIKIRTTKANASRICDMLDLPNEMITNKERAGCSTQEEIKFQDVNFSYDKEKKVLQGLTFSIKHGEVVAFVGHSGCGKSTIVKLLSGLYSPDSGNITINGMPLEENLATIRNKISVVAQENYVFANTIRKNLVLGKENITDGELDRACQNAGILDYVRKLPNGYDTVLDESGVNISGGQRQRLCIARAFLHNKEILILDEPTSALDIITERYLQKTITALMKDKTVIIIAHKLSTIKSADKIFVINKGRVVEEGNHETLIEKKGIYYNLNTAKEWGQ